jgi:RecJ-like exonuclease
MDTFLCNDDGDIVLSVYDGLLTESSTSTTVSSADQVLNVYGEITSASVSSGATSFTVDDASLFGVGMTY